MHAFDGSMFNLMLLSREPLPKSEGRSTEREEGVCEEERKGMSGSLGTLKHSEREKEERLLSRQALFSFFSPSKLA